MAVCIQCGGHVVQSFQRFSRLAVVLRARFLMPNTRFSHSQSSVSVQVGGRSLTFSSGKLANIADGSVVVQYGETALLVTAVSSQKQTDVKDFLPLVVDYREKASAAGRIPLNFHRRELLPTEREILIGRSIDRSIRSLFRKGYALDTQITCNLLASDGINNPDVAALNGASAALAVSNIPWNGPVGAVRIGEVDGMLTVNPMLTQLDKSTLNLVVACSETKVVMLEGTAKEVSTERFCEAIRLAYVESQPIIKALKQFREHAGKVKREHTPPSPPPEELAAAIERLAVERVNEILSNPCQKKLERDDAMFSLGDECVEKLQGVFPTLEPRHILDAYFSLCRSVLRGNILQKLQRCDGRTVDAVRPLSCEVDLFSPLHGSALFTRGETQVFSTVTLGPAGLAGKVDINSEVIGGEKEKEFMLHYEFPPFSTNETGRVGGFNRRELGHGKLAEKALQPVIPSDFPFTLRLTAQVLSSNGSSSMASACAGSLALMDAGVPIRKPVAGSACGLITTPDASNPQKPDIDDYQLLTDILVERMYFLSLGLKGFAFARRSLLILDTVDNSLLRHVGIEDYMGDMDFKMAGTRDGITSVQVDFKIPGLPVHIVEEAARKCTDDRMKVLDVMDNVLSESRKEGKSNKPVITTIKVPPKKRARFVGAGGFAIRSLQQETGATFSSENEEEFTVYAPNEAALKQTLTRVDEILSEKDWDSLLKQGSSYTGVITEIRDYGAMVELFPSMPPILLHVSEMDNARVRHPSDIELNVGDSVKVKFVGFDLSNNKPKISRRALLPRTAQRKGRTAKGDRLLDIIFEDSKKP